MNQENITLQNREVPSINNVGKTIISFLSNARADDGTSAAFSGSLHTVSLTSTQPGNMRFPD